MRCRRAIRTALVFVLLGAGVTVFTSWAIHAVQYSRVRSNTNATMGFVPSLTWPFDPALARRFGVDTTSRPGQSVAAAHDREWAMVLESRASGVPFLDDATGIEADTLWRRHRRPSTGLSPLPEYRYPYPMFEAGSTSIGWRVLVSDVDLCNDAFDPEHGVINETLLVVRMGWPFAAMEAGAHRAMVLEFHPPHPSMHVSRHGYKRVEEIQRPPHLSISSGIELWAAPPPPVATTRPFRRHHGVTDRFALPLLPIWPGFLLNTFFYAILIFALIRTPRLAIRARRRRRGRCERCGHDLGGLDAGAACPECGASVPPPRATAAARAT